jgi:DNA-binding XRE family transcriptional regulator
MRHRTTEDDMKEQEITNESVRMLRKTLGLGQAEFWGPIGVKQAAASGYENDTAIPKPVRILVVARYICGIHVDAETDDGVEKASMLGAIQQKSIKAKAIAGEVKQDLAKAAKSIQTAHDALSSY